LPPVSRSSVREHRGNVARAAAASGISRQRAYRLLKDKSAAELMRDLEVHESPDE